MHLFCKLNIANECIHLLTTQGDTAMPQKSNIAIAYNHGLQIQQILGSEYKNVDTNIDLGLNIKDTKLGPRIG